jgi:hypothetical protein
MFRALIFRFNKFSIEISDEIKAPVTQNSSSLSCFLELFIPKVNKVYRNETELRRRSGIKSQFKLEQLVASVVQSITISRLIKAKIRYKNTIKS